MFASCYDVIPLSLVPLYERTFYKIEGNWLHGTSRKHLQRRNTISRVIRRYIVSCVETRRGVWITNFTILLQRLQLFTNFIHRYQLKGVGLIAIRNRISKPICFMSNYYWYSLQRYSEKIFKKYSFCHAFVMFFYELLKICIRCAVNPLSYLTFDIIIQTNFPF